MTLLLDASELAARRSVAEGALAPLARGLHGELVAVIGGAVEIPREKALLSRVGGRCPHDGTFLRFDPYGTRHVCPRCGADVRGELHDRFRPYWYQLWLAERVVHAAVLGALFRDDDALGAASRLLEGYADRYLAYPNRDNVLGPSRPFFSTYLESIWLLQLAVALDLLETASATTTVASLGALVRDRVIEPSVRLIASYDEGMSNRQVWNNAALIAAGSLLQMPRIVDRAIEGPSGLHAHLSRSLLRDGSWYEGENYHLFAHRGLWYGVTMAERLGRAVPPALSHRFDEGFASPFRTVLPDLTYPSRRDSQYAVSVRQPRFAESCELGLARREDPRLVGMLARLYDPSIPRRDPGRASSTADVERNLPATGLSRADLSWRSLLFARETLPPLVPEPLRSDLLPAQGYGIVRRDDGRVYVALDYGHSGGGHGHPDRLNLLLSDGDARWFDDPGTGSYVDESLHWYRSTLAHTAPLVDGRSQPRVHGELLAFDDTGDAGWIAASAALAPGCTVRRTVVVLADYLLDVVEWSGAQPHELSLPLHGVHARSATGATIDAIPAAIEGGSASEDGFSFLRETARLQVDGTGTLALESAPDAAPHEILHGLMFTPLDATGWRAVVPGAPGRDAHPMVLVRATARSGTFATVWGWRRGVLAVERTEAGICVTRTDGSVHMHRATSSGWEIRLEEAGARRIVELGGVVPAASGSTAERRNPELSADPGPAIPLPARFTLGEPHYRRSEESWAEAGSPEAFVEIALDAAHRELVATVDVPRSSCLFVPLTAENPYDNEPAAINGDGVQLYVGAGSLRGGWLLVPVPGGEQVDVRPIDEWAGELAPTARWSPLPHGYRLIARVSVGEEATDARVDVLVNETAPGRTRRRGQLVLSGADGEFVYLRGDRHEPARLLRFSLDND